MTDIPEDIMREAGLAVGRNHRWIGPHEARSIVARAILAERERCAKLATSFLVGDPANGVPLRNPMAHEIAAAIRGKE